MNVHISKAIRHLSQGHIIAYPTEGVWGLGCNPFNRHAVQRILDIKHRPEHKGLILITSKVEYVNPWLSNLPEENRQIVLASWPGPHTWVFPEMGLLPKWITGKHASVAIRVSAHPLVRELCNAWGGLLVSTSANVATRPAAVRRVQIQKTLANQIDYILPGETSGLNKPSQIRNALTGAQIR
ncbi:L-threonylcarbamoyladenylate synthase [Gynuella sunshinyii]|uniref:Threonylcarbamoyl-AMP synthase n=1 Tax=Gynuella sunshinyii YC6258 TaxID=1445510 RepID=A0A0C5VH36_9GAMM|nr:L-threonylcarbamoyladenylate synthase [Gynuella sunshinyii]AJQ92653.1 putative translation factor (SUA5) [Gynuella sunshinyii YC6258]